MFSAAELIDALRRRGRRSLRPETAPGEFPPGWAQWFEAISRRIGRITGATADAIVAVLLLREPAMPPRSAAELNRWQAFATLWRQQWQPPEREDRRARASAIAITVFVHLVLLVLLVWLASVRLAPVSAPAGEDVVQVEFIGEGTPRDQGGGSPSAATATPAPPLPHPARASPSPAIATTAPQPPAPSPSAEAAQSSQAPLAEQPLQVSEKPVPEATFALPPPTPRLVELPQAPRAEPKLQEPVRDIEVVQPLPQVRALQPRLPETAAAVPQLRTTPQAVEIRQPLPAVKPIEAVAQQPAPSPAPTLRQAPSDIPLREAPSAPAASSTTGTRTASANSASTAPSTTPSSTPAPSTAPSAQSGTRQASTAPGRGPAAAAKPGAWPTPRRGDDWGASTREKPGGQAGASPGLLNSDGTPRLGAGTAEAGGGYPPGSDHWTMDQIDRAGTWLKRPSNTYEATRFDKVWVPNETLLEQWVRQNIRSMDIPIPGTTKKLHCVVSLLQLGGGCGITDPDLQDQEATARPPPDVPFKPDLQEDQGSLGTPVAP